MRDGPFEATLPSRVQYFAPLTALRGIAALFVVVFHAPGFGLGSYLISATQFVLRGYLWVDFFFVLSGFVLAHAYGALFRARIERSAVATYLRARFARIYPLHAASLVILLALELVRRLAFDHHPALYFGMSLDARMEPNTFLPALLLVHALGALPVDVWNSPSWSISCEAAVYFLFPVLALALARAPSRAAALFLAGGTAMLLLIYFGLRPHDLDASSSFGFFRCFAEFSFGLCCHAWYARRGVPRRLAGDGAAIGVVVALALVLHTGVPDLLAIPLFCLLILAAVGNEGRFRRVLLARPLQRLGDISYSIYLMHWPVMSALGMAIYAATGIDPTIDEFGLATRFGFLAMTVGLTVIAAQLTYRTVELPFRQHLAGRHPRRVPALSLDAEDTVGAELIPAPVHAARRREGG